MLSFLTQLCSPAGKLRHIYPKLNCLTEVKYPNAQRNWFPYSKYPRTQLPRRYSRKKLESFGQGFLAAKSIYRLISKRFWPWWATLLLILLKDLQHAIVTKHGNTRLSALRRYENEEQERVQCSAMLPSLCVMNETRSIVIFLEF